MVRHSTQAKAGLTALAALGFLSGGAWAQGATPPPKPSGPPKSQPEVQVGPLPAPEVSPGKAPRKNSGEPRLVDAVMMTIDNRVILLSEVEDDYRARIAGQANLDARARQQIYQEARMAFLRAAIHAQSAWTIPDSTPEQIQKIVDSELKRRRQQEIRDIGSVNKMNQEMGLMSQSSFIVERREREAILTAIAQQDITKRFRDRLALIITPKELRAHYKSRRGELATPPRADLALVRFAVTAPGESAAVRKQVADAAAAWRKGEQTSTEIAEAFAGQALPDRLDLTPTDAASLLPSIHAFVTSATGVSVSEPIRSGDAFYLLKIIRWQPAAEFRWEDPKVQARLRDELLQVQYARILNRLNEDRAKTLKIWTASGQNFR